MSRVKQIQFEKEHRYQGAICAHARKEFIRRLARDEPAGGVVLADGVGLGKTYEALGTAVSLLSQLQHRKSRKKRKAFRIIVLVPPSLVSKWSDELILPDKFLRYLDSWTSPTTRAVAETFHDVVVLRRMSDLVKAGGEFRYGRRVMPAGLYIVNSNVLRKAGKRIERLRHTSWDVVIVDEAHHIAEELSDILGFENWHSRKTALLLLTATPFQMSPQEMKGLLAATFCGELDPTACAQDLYATECFTAYRKNVTKYFNEGDERAAKEAVRLSTKVRALLLPRVVRNRKVDRRAYHLVDEAGTHHRLAKSPFGLADGDLNTLLRNSGLVQMTPPVARIYLNERDQISQAAARTEDRPFVSAALRQLLSSWQQYANSHFGRDPRRGYEFSVPSVSHPKVEAVSLLVRNLLEQEVANATAQSVGKILIFTTYVGSEGGQDRRSEELGGLGTAAALKKKLTRVLNAHGGRVDLFPKADVKTSERIKLALHKVVAKVTPKRKNPTDEEVGLTEQEARELKNALSRFAGSPAARFALADDVDLDGERRMLKHLLEAVSAVRSPDSAADEAQLSESRRRLAARRRMLFKQVLDRYSTRDLVARYDGASTPEERDRHLRGFNSPFAPFVLIASSVGQEGIDLQQYCRHVVHYDLEWNPAKLEQREGRVDRKGRRTEGPVNVYFLLCSGTYDERIMHVMTNRFRWHQVLLGHKNALQHEPAEGHESDSDPVWLRKMVLDLSPPGAPRSGVAA